MQTKNDKAKSGFKTFIVTLSVSLVIFSSIYYLLGHFTDTVDIENFEVQEETAMREDDVRGVTSRKTDNSDVSSDSSSSPFADLNETSPQVLAEHDETDTTDDTTTDDTTTTTTTTDETDESTESAVPETGSNTLMGVILSTGFFALALFVILSGPREFALSKFEDSMLNKD